MLEMIGGAVMVAGGGMLTASSVVLGQLQRRATEFGRGMRRALDDTTSAPPPPDMLALLDKIP